MAIRAICKEVGDAVAIAFSGGIGVRINVCIANLYEKHTPRRTVLVLSIERDETSIEEHLKEEYITDYHVFLKHGIDLFMSICRTKYVNVSVKSQMVRMARMLCRT
jgi:hypothetical protein